MNKQVKTMRDAAHFATMPDSQIREELLKLCIAERFDGDIAFLTRLYDGDHSFEKGAELRAMVITTNPGRHSSVYPPAPGEPPIPRPDYRVVGQKPTSST